MFPGWVAGYAQITIPITKARFGVDADLRTNFFDGAITSGNDDWFNNGTPGTGEFVIDTTGAAAMIAAYLSDVSPFPKRMSSFYRTMSKPQFSIVANRLWLDAIFVRDYHGNDTTVFTAGADKNGMSPANWTGGVQSIPDKNDILDIMVHVRRAGPNTTDSLWMFGGISLDNTTGNRYFDFEMYQSDIYYDRASKKFYGYGPDAGHTSWKFDAAGNIVSPGDIIFNGEFQSGTLTKIEARIWVSRADWQTVVPTSFNWGTAFDGSGSGSAYGYAAISPNTSGAFYTGLGSSNNTWAGPFGLVLQDNSLAFTNPGPASTTNGKYIANQFIEFSVNLTKLGLDPVTLLGGDVCGTPFNRIIIKTRASASFTAELKDFVAPTDLFLAPRALAATETPFICDDGSGVAEITVTNPISTSTYVWSTPDGNIISSPTGPSIYVDHSGTYIVRQYLQMGCSVYATDTIQVGSFPTCEVLSTDIIDLRGVYADQRAKLQWTVAENAAFKYFEIQRSFDGRNFATVGNVEYSAATEYKYEDVPGTSDDAPHVYYRIRMVHNSGNKKFSSVISLSLGLPGIDNINVWPNPVFDKFQVQINASSKGRAVIDIFSSTGQSVYSTNKYVQKGSNSIMVEGLTNQPRGVYFIKVQLADQVFHKKVMFSH